MKILVIGSGGREHAIAWKLSQDERVEKIFVAPGNGGTAIENKCENINIGYNDISALLKFAESNSIDLTVVGPEEPLSKGIVDEFEKNNLLIFGPNKNAAEIEASKSFAKDIMKQASIATASYEEFNDFDSAKIITMAHCLDLAVECDYTFYGKLNDFLLREETVILDAQFTDNVKVIFRIKSEKKKALICIRTFFIGLLNIISSLS